MNEKEKQKAESRVRILDAAARLFREDGFSATGVDALMKEAGLTAGAFYAHFKSKDELFDKTLEHIFNASAARLTKGLDLAAGRKTVQEFMTRYVCEGHRDHPDLGCAIPAIGSEISRHSKKTGAQMSGYLNRWVGLFERNLEGTPRQRREEALRLVSQAVGAILLSRMVSGDLSTEILSAGARVK